MKFEIKYFTDNYWQIRLEDIWGDDYAIANYLGLTKKEYVDILISHGAIKPCGCLNYYFKNKKKMEKVIKKLEPLLIMANLIN